ncbi:NUDIX domain-containing protein [Microbacterium protaetiae]|uniref:NUDIX domain-containing protein n=1 Tax=Microbacterium protaetiae TaxID=2509458 RepID=A0A4P6EIQ2_9MICO|nr:NUDIX domain-containing protein [Microbacterium protaetiae]QAY61149.1 NUDIX domain-containing protein [Microbacterium protaetiae]
MPTPEFVLDLRKHIGHAPLPLVGVTAVVFRGDRVLLGRRADNGERQPVSGIVEPGEEPADAAVREVREEAGIVARATRLAWVHQMDRVTYANGDAVDYLTLTFRCEWVSGEPHPVDGELTEVGWYAPTELDELDDDHRRRVELARNADEPARYEGGR